MNKLDEQILEEITRRVIERERELKEKEDFHLLKDATISKLSENTIVPEEEIDIIKAEVHDSIYEKHRKQKQTEFYIVFGSFIFLDLVSLLMISENAYYVFLSLICTAGIFFSIFYYKKQLKPRKIIVEYFGKSDYKWIEGVKMRQERCFKDNSYIFSAGTADWCYWDRFEIDLPENFSVKLHSTWLSGKYDSFGPIFSDAEGNYLCCQLTGEGSANYVVKCGKDWTSNTAFKYSMGADDKINVQYVEFRGKNFDYYVNDKLAYSGDTDKMNKITETGIRVCDIQTMKFTDFELKNLDTGEVLFYDDFKNPSALWKPVNDFEYKKYFDNGNYIIESNTEDWCYWSFRDVEVSGNCELTLIARPIDGETDNFGLAIYTGEESHLFFKVKATGETCVEVSNGNENTGGNNIYNSGYKFDKNTPAAINVKIVNNRYRFYINDFFVDSGVIKYSTIPKIAVRVCGKQKVAFEKLIIIER